MTQPGILCSFEGISGVGKSYLTNALKTLMTDVPVTFVSEVVDRCGRELDRDIIDILSASGDRFFRGGRPRTETFLLLALKMFDFEARIAPLLAEGHLVIEDRSIDTIAIYQALILHPEEPEQQLRTAHELYALASCWRQPPQVTFLIVDHFDVALARVEQREKQRLTEDEIAVLRQASSLYTQYARAYPSRMVSLHRQRLSNHALLHRVREHLLTMRMCVSAENPSALLTE